MLLEEKTACAVGSTLHRSQDLTRKTIFIILSCSSRNFEENLKVDLKLNLDLFLSVIFRCVKIFFNMIFWRTCLRNLFKIWLFDLSILVRFCILLQVDGRKLLGESPSILHLCLWMEWVTLWRNLYLLESCKGNWAKPEIDNLYVGPVFNSRITLKLGKKILITVSCYRTSILCHVNWQL